MRYETKFTASNGKSGQFVYENSYNVGSLQTWCIITGILYGGACWGYLSYPSKDHDNFVTSDAKIKLANLIGTTDIGFENTRITKTTWGGKPESHKLSLSSRTNDSQSDNNKKINPSDDMEGFLK
jgi:hypothetical protein